MGSMLMRLAPLATTGVGSLPFTRPGEAARHAVGGYELPFCPQLPHAYGDMVQEWLGADPARCGWAPDRDRQLPAVWDHFILELERHPPSHGMVKLQVTGPRVDEPGLMAAQRAGARPGAWDALRATAPVWGVHVCGEVPWRLVDAAEPDVISYYICRFGCPRAAQTAIRRLMRRGGRIMWGAVDAAVAVPPLRTVARVRTVARAVAGRRWRTTDVLDASLLSGGCGTGSVSTETERQLARALRVAASVGRGDPMPARPTLTDSTLTATPPLARG
jgi:hypothetical protein